MVIKGGCKWCERGECWTHGGTAKGGGGAKGGFQKGGKNLSEASLLLELLGGSGGGGGGGCKWCAMGECWGCKESGKGGGKGFGKSFGKGGGKGKLKGSGYSREMGVKRTVGKGSGSVSLGKLKNEEASEAEVEDFLLNGCEGCDEQSKNKFKVLHPKLQALVIQKGPMEEADNKSKRLMSRCRKAEGFAANMQAGDWICAGCGGFRSTTDAECRKCGVLKP